MQGRGDFFKPNYHSHIGILLIKGFANYYLKDQLYNLSFFLSCNNTQGQRNKGTEESNYPPPSQILEDLEVKPVPFDVLLLLRAAPDF